MQVEELTELLNALSDWSSIQKTWTLDDTKVAFMKRTTVRELIAVKLNLRDRHAISSWITYLKGLKILDQICDYSNGNFYVNLDQLKNAFESSKLLQTHTRQPVQKGLEHYIKNSVQD